MVVLRLAAVSLLAPYLCYGLCFMGHIGMNAMNDIYHTKLRERMLVLCLAWPEYTCYLRSFEWVVIVILEIKKIDCWVG